MDNMFIGFITAFWLGLLTSVSPCPLASNIAAVSFLSQKIIHPKLVLFSSLAYTFGRMLAYSLLGILLIKSLLSVPVLANFLQEYMNKAIGPLLIITALFLLGILKINIPSLMLSHRHQNKLAEGGAGGALILGFVFALVFCPVSAALFFGSLIPIALSQKTGVALPFIYGIGTGLPVLLFALGIAMGISSLNHWFHKFINAEVYMRKATAAIFIIVGLYYIRIYLIRAF